VPAGGFANRSRAAPGPRSTGMTTGLRGARLTEDRPKRVTPATPGLRKRGTGAEPKVDASALASAAAERREASDPRWGRVRARARSGGNVCQCGADNWLVRLSALRLPSMIDGRQRLTALFAKLGRPGAARALRHCERSEAIQLRARAGLLRRFAPRNDGLSSPAQAGRTISDPYLDLARRHGFNPAQIVNNGRQE
jgi:hypothetical protein